MTDTISVTRSNPTPSPAPSPSTNSRPTSSTPAPQSLAPNAEEVQQGMVDIGSAPQDDLFPTLRELRSVSHGAAGGAGGMGAAGGTSGPTSISEAKTRPVGAAAAAQIAEIRSAAQEGAFLDNEDYALEITPNESDAWDFNVELEADDQHSLVKINLEDLEAQRQEALANGERQNPIAELTTADGEIVRLTYNGLDENGLALLNIGVLANEDANGYYGRRIRLAA